MFSCGDDGKTFAVIIWNMYTGKVIDRLQGIHDDVRQITTSKDDEFLFLGTALGYVLVYDLTTYELLSPKYIKIASPISALEFNEKNHQLIIATEDGFIMSYNIYEGEEKLIGMLKNKEFDTIQKEAELNPILAYTQIYNLISNLWENTLAKAKEGKLSLAYSLCNTYPAYKDSKLYKALAERWKKTFMQAQKYVLDPKGIESAKEVLKPYRGISEKTKLIQELLTQGESIQMFSYSNRTKRFYYLFRVN